MPGGRTVQARRPEHPSPWLECRGGGSGSHRSATSQPVPDDTPRAPRPRERRRLGLLLAQRGGPPGLVARRGSAVRIRRASGAPSRLLTLRRGARADPGLDRLPEQRLRHRRHGVHHGPGDVDVIDSGWGMAAFIALQTILIIAFGEIVPKILGRGPSRADRRASSHRRLVVVRRVMTPARLARCRASSSGRVPAPGSRRARRRRSGSWPASATRAGTSIPRRPS